MLPLQIKENIYDVSVFTAIRRNVALLITPI